MGRIEELERKVTILTRLAETSAVLNSTMRLKPLLSSIMDTAADIVDAEAASVLLWDYKKQELVFAATTTGDSNGQALIGKQVPLEGSIAGTVMRENRIVAVGNIRTTTVYYSKIDEQIAFQTRSVLGVPMRSRNRIIGVLEAVNRRNETWTEDDGYYLSVLAAQAAVAIEGAQLVTQLQLANEELNQLDKLKSDFIAIASHELRTPLGVILGYASFLQDTDDPQVREHASKMVNSAMHLRRIIEDLTNLRYLEQSSLELNREDVLVGDLVRELIAEIQPLVEAKRHDLTFVPSPFDVHISIDRIRIVMALSNVLNNAIRFTPDGGRITIHVEQRAHEIWVNIIDNGIGLAKDQLERIFERFYQIEDHMTRVNGGLGIGLSIARALVEAHGGRLWATSRGLGQGSTFTVVMPINE
ncbi:MAG: GAF domain-containing sensor histidine kinase [Chloroflexota bacterium]|nr:GAF domain-containing sensor histidine kinase [Chloroflexota bacterium]